MGGSEACDSVGGLQNKTCFDVRMGAVPEEEQIFRFGRAHIHLTVHDDPPKRETRTVGSNSMQFPTLSSLKKSCWFSARDGVIRQNRSLFLALSYNMISSDSVRMYYYRRPVDIILLNSKVGLQIHAVTHKVPLRGFLLLRMASTAVRLVSPVSGPPPKAATVPSHWTFPRTQDTECEDDRTEEAMGKSKIS